MTNTSNSHPDSAELDLLHAGLLDEMAEQKASLLHHLATCERCCLRAGRWKQIAHGDTAEDTSLSRQLRERRHLAIEGRASKRSHRQVKTRFVVSAVAAAVFLSLGTFLGLGIWHPHQPTPSIARADNVPDLYSDIDFYLWVSHEGAPVSGHENQS